MLFIIKKKTKLKIKILLGTNDDESAVVGESRGGIIIGKSTFKTKQKHSKHIQTTAKKENISNQSHSSDEASAGCTTA